MAQTKIKASNIAVNAVDTGHFHTTAFTNLNQHLIPDTNSVYDLGTAEKKWRHLYLSDATIYLGDNTKMSVDSDGNLEVKDENDNPKPIKARSLEIDDETADPTFKTVMKKVNGKMKFVKVNRSTGIEESDSEEVDLSMNSIGDLSNVDLTVTPQLNQTIIWNGTSFVPGESFSQSDFNTAFAAKTVGDLSDGSSYATTSYVDSSAFYQYTTSPATPSPSADTVISIGTNGSSYDYVQSHASKPLNLNPVGNEVQISGKTLFSGSEIVLPTRTSDPTGQTGSAYFNTSDDALKIKSSSGDWGSVVFSALGTQENPAPSGYALYQNDSSLPTGYYWIQSSNMSSPIQMWVDMQYGGYDFYAFQGNGISVTYANQSHSGSPLGLDICYARSPNWWRAASNYVRNATGNSPLSGSYADYFRIVYGVHKTSGGGNYTGTIMRHPNFGSGSSAHRVNDGGQWWTRNSTFGEPNGDYTAYAWFGLQAGGYTMPNPYTGQDIGFNDGNAAYSTGGYYLVSTNGKPD